MGTKSKSLTKELLVELGKLIAAYIPELKGAIYAGWPESNKELKLPSISMIYDGNPLVNPKINFDLIREVVTNEYLYGIADLEANLQLDLWASNKEERHKIVEKLMVLFNLAKLEYKAGLSATLKDYYDVGAIYSLRSINLDDSEQQAMTKEWRARLIVSASSIVVHKVRQSAIIEHEIEDDISEFVIIA